MADPPPTPPASSGNAETPGPDFSSLKIGALAGTLRTELLSRQAKLDAAKASQVKAESEQLQPMQMAPKRKRKRRKKTPGMLKGQELANLPQRKLIVELRVQGKSTAEIAEIIGLSQGSVSKHLRTWVLSNTPPDEKTEELRQLYETRIEALHDRHWQRAMGRRDPETGEWIVPPNQEAGEFCLKLLDRGAKLNGVDLQPANVTMMISAESIAAYLGWDPQPGMSAVDHDISDDDVLEIPEEAA